MADIFPHDNHCLEPNNKPFDVLNNRFQTILSPCKSACKIWVVYYPMYIDLTNGSRIFVWKKEEVGFHYKLEFGSKWLMKENVEEEYLYIIKA